MFLGLDLVLYILGYLFIVHVTLFRLIVLYSRCRVNRGINLSLVLYYVIFSLLSLCVWASVSRYQLVGCVPTMAASTSYHLVSKLGLFTPLLNVWETLVGRPFASNEVLNGRSGSLQWSRQPSS